MSYVFFWGSTLTHVIECCLFMFVFVGTILIFSIISFIN